GQVLYSLAWCHAHLGRPEEALPLLDQLIKRDPRWSNYAAWRLLIETRTQAKDRPGALEACRELVRWRRRWSTSASWRNTFCRKGGRKRPGRSCSSRSRPTTSPPGRSAAATARGPTWPGGY